MSVEPQKVEEVTSVEIEQEEDKTNASAVVDIDSDGQTKTEIVADDNSDELENYSDNVKKRINQLTAKRKQAIEEADAAYQYAQQKEQENTQLKERLNQLNQGYNNEYENRVKSQTAQVKEIYKKAYDAGDSEKMAEAQNLMSRLAVEEERLRVQKAQVEQQKAQQQPQAQQIQQPQAQQVQQPIQQQRRDPKLESWLEKNNWFGSDQIMTNVAKTIHEQIVRDEGFDPLTDEYYQEIDKRMRAELPHKFQDKRANVQAVTPASNGRNVKSGRKKSVQLTPGQVAFANKMRIPLERYAKEVAKLENKRS
tara:strand:- start:4287 stop:5213 length:927 start_codon:yes stop_codon:yes gene_type:complete